MQVLLNIPLLRTLEPRRGGEDNKYPTEMVSADGPYIVPMWRVTIDPSPNDERQYYTIVTNHEATGKPRISHLQS